MPRTRYSIQSIQKAALYDDGYGDGAQTGAKAEQHWTLVLLDGPSGKRYIYRLAQPPQRPLPHVVGGVLELDARLLEPE